MSRSPPESTFAAKDVAAEMARWLAHLKTERRMSGKTVEAFRVIPRIQNITRNGYASRLNDAAIWLSADERRLPIRLSSKIVFGTVQLDLIDDKRGTQSTSAGARQPAS